MKRYLIIDIICNKGLSRGRGIVCLKNLVEIEDYVSSKESQWIAQKYIENPLIINERKVNIVSFQIKTYIHQSLI